MEATIVQKFLPFIIFILSGALSNSVPKVFYIGLPAMAICFHLYYPDSEWLQITLLFIWALFVWGTRRAVAFADIDVYASKPLFIILVALSAAIAIPLVLWIGIDIQTAKILLGVVVLMAGGTATLYHGVVKPVVLYVVPPLFVRSRTPMRTTLSDYTKAAQGHPRGKFWHNYIRFKDDPTTYEVGLLQFRRYRNKVNVPFSYIKCKCLFGVEYIYRIDQLSEIPGRPSRWESSSTTKIENKIQKYALISAVIILILALIVVGMALFLKG